MNKKVHTESRKDAKQQGQATFFQTVGKRCGEHEGHSPPMQVMSLLSRQDDLLQAEHLLHKVHILP